MPGGIAAAKVQTELLKCSAVTSRTAPSVRKSSHYPKPPSFAHRTSTAHTSSIDQTARDRRLVPLHAGARQIRRRREALHGHERVGEEVLAPVHVLQPMSRGRGGEHVGGIVWREVRG